MAALLPIILEVVPFVVLLLSFMVAAGLFWGAALTSMAGGAKQDFEAPPTTTTTAPPATMSPALARLQPLVEVSPSYLPTRARGVCLVLTSTICLCARACAIVLPVLTYGLR
eukprot:2755429-Rhodomonas_salina.1